MWYIVQWRLNAMISSQPEPVISKYAWSPHEVVNTFHTLFAVGGRISLMGRETDCINPEQRALLPSKTTLMR